MTTKSSLKNAFTLISVILLTGAACSFCGTCRAAGNVSTSVTLDPDGDDPRTELLYHWQDKRFSDEEQHQILLCSALILVVSVGGAAKRQIRLKKVLK